MSDFTDKLKAKAEAVSAAIDNELTVLEGVGGDDPLAHHEDDEQTDDEPGTRS
ncbi:MAG: hypothetical protein QM809_05795 [Gordonia sp. (in: high G+C Gram-positive bacteria)]|uniref:hypothetical protein n=1 Tax=Gordonia sp. (in: high G+C Gram-positive bacteria) TaxID=84139 RepID=UPI0039E3FCA1